MGDRHQLVPRTTAGVDRPGYTVTKPGGRQRAAVAVLLWRISHSEDEPADSDG
ncbi:hypothetical protein [Streptomyces sp. T028]|uniref:hypothetical protein n=1 Tax=Streptomyces sp. T028 TaxID=3394379 RepID=UPI003A84A35F